MSQCLYPRFIIFIFLSITGIFIFSYLAKKINNNKFLNIFSSLSLVMFSTQRIIFKFIDLLSVKLNITIIGSKNYFVILILFLGISIIYLLYYQVKYKLGVKYEKK